MDLFDMFDLEPTGEVQKTPVELVDELNMIIQKHGYSLPVEVLVDLASYYQDPPPWSPWVK